MAVTLERSEGVRFIRDSSPSAQNGMITESRYKASRCRVA